MTRQRITHDPWMARPLSEALRGIQRPSWRQRARTALYVAAGVGFVVLLGLAGAEDVAMECARYGCG